MSSTQFDVIIIGSGLAGLTLALHLGQHKKIAVICKHQLIDGASDWAQGGIAAVLDSTDSIDEHVADTLTAGAGLCDEATVRHIVSQGHATVQWLIEQGVPFTRDSASESGYHLTKEGGHSHRRIIHADDMTGHAVQTTLEDRVRAHPNIALFERHFAVDLVTRRKLGLSGENRCVGAYILDSVNGTVRAFTSDQVVLASGGAGKVYLYTTNPDTATGDGIAMAWRAGAAIANMEFMQFHPTCLYHPYAKSFLITEAVRGEGGVLRIPETGERFMLAHDERAELAPRDVVARAIDFEMKKRGLDFVHLDITHKGEDFLRAHFPNIFAQCEQFGINIATDPIPVVPAMHFTCGGVVTNWHGATDIPGLYAIGEAAYTGLHGANRLASNSLLECLVMGRACAADIMTQGKTDSAQIPPWDDSRVSDADEEVVIAHNWDELRRFMWNYVGIVRTTKRLERAQHRVKLLTQEIDEYYQHFRISTDLLELRNLVLVADLIIQSALQRKESRGLHFCRDYPEVLAKRVITILKSE